MPASSGSVSLLCQKIEKQGRSSSWRCRWIMIVGRAKSGKRTHAIAVAELQPANCKWLEKAGFCHCFVGIFTH
jgi:hypothetical protein